MSEYPRDLLISESVIRDFEERVGVRFINKTECAKALDEHDAKVRADERTKVIDEILFRISKITTYYAGDKDGKAITPVMFIRDEVVKTVEQMSGRKKEIKI